MARPDRDASLCAFWVTADPDWGAVVVASSHGRAKTAFRREYPAADWTPDYTDIRARKLNLAVPNGVSESVLLDCMDGFWSCEAWAVSDWCKRCNRFAAKSDKRTLEEIRDA